MEFNLLNKKDSAPHIMLQILNSAKQITEAVIILNNPKGSLKILKSILKKGAKERTNMQNIETPM